MNSLRLSLALGALAGLASGVSAQQVALSEDFNAGMPGSFTLTNINGDPASIGWIGETGNFATPGVEHEDESGGHTAHNAMDTSAFSLVGATTTYVHFDSYVAWAQYQANHPSSLGDGYSNLEVSTDNGVTFSTGHWVDTQQTSNLVTAVDIDISSFVGSANTVVRFEYYGTYAHNWGIDNLIINDDPNTPPPPPPAPITWTHMNLPTTFVGVAGGLTEDFEAAAGVVQPYMAVTMYDPVLMVEPDPEGWCNIGQLGAMAGTPFGGAYSLEMALIPGTTNYHTVQNSLILGLNGGGQASHSLDVQAIDLGDELHSFDGIWVSENGTDWYLINNCEGASSWFAVSEADISFGGTVDLTGDFYLMFAQDDNFPYNGADGRGFDDIMINGGGSGGPSLGLVGTCGQVGSGLAASGMTPNGNVGFAWSTMTGNFVIGGAACAGTSVGILNPQLIAVVSADGSGNAVVLPGSGIPSQGCGLVHCQAVDIATCAPTNVLSL